MKQLQVILVLVFMTGAAIAQSSEYTAHNKGWLVDLDEAIAESERTDKPIMANFTGSDWCGWCKRLTASVFAKPEFKEWADDNVVLLELDFPRRTKIPAKYQQQNYGLQQAFKVTGYPTVWVFNMNKNSSTGKYEIEALGKTGYAKSVGDFTGAVDQMINR